MDIKTTLSISETLLSVYIYSDGSFSSVAFVGWWGGEEEEQAAGWLGDVWGRGGREERERKRENGRGREGEKRRGRGEGRREGGREEGGREGGSGGSMSISQYSS